MKRPLRRDPRALAVRRRINLIVMAALVIAAAFLWPRPESTPPAPASPPGTNPPPAPAQAPSFEKLVGRWLRPDGDYALEVRQVESTGRAHAGYFNPGPIHVARAEAAREGGSLQLVVELRDVNYPGSTYTLAYDPRRDLLQGQYYQPALDQTFDVVFIRAQ